MNEQEINRKVSELESCGWRFKFREDGKAVMITAPDGESIFGGVERLEEMMCKIGCIDQGTKANDAAKQ